MACTLSYCFRSATWSTTVHTGFMFLTICANCYWQTIGLDSIEASLTPYSVTSLAAGPVLVTIWSTVADLAAKTCPPAISIHSLQKYFYSLVRTYLFIDIVQNKFANQGSFLSRNMAVHAERKSLTAKYQWWWVGTWRNRWRRWWWRR